MECDATETADQALQWLRAGRRFDVAVLDMQMPVMDGIQLGREIRQLHDHDDMPLVMLTSLGRREEAAEAVGFAAFLHKPSKSSSLYNALVGVLDGRPEPQPVKTDATPDQNMASRHPLRILVAADNAVNQKVAISMLARMGYTCEIANNGREAVLAVQNTTYDVVLMDVLMPELDGIRASQAIRTLADVTIQPRIVAMTANAMEGDRETCLEAGMDDYVSKPVRVEELVTALLRVPASGDAAAAADLDVSPTHTAANPEQHGLMPSTNATTCPVGQQDADDVLTALRETIGDQADNLLPELSELFQEEGPRLLCAIREAINDADHQRLAAAAHTLKSSSASLGSQNLSKVCEQLETLGRTGTTTGAAEHIASLDEGYTRFTAILDLASRRSPVATEVPQHP
jgi:CheY-like chemotaxis protein/HPt (histidine-containing phosphotransfer) domain-containing protein